MSSTPPTAEEVEAVLERKAAARTKPTDDDLRPVYNYLRSTFVSERNESSSSSAAQPPHWYCSRTPERLHREAATYLIFLFAFNRVERAQLWIKELEGVLRSCDKCSRCFTPARKRFASK
jgi:senataxin